MEDLYAPPPAPRRPRKGRLGARFLDHLPKVLLVVMLWSGGLLFVLDWVGYRGWLDDACVGALVLTGMWGMMFVIDRINPLP